MNKNKNGLLDENGNYKPVDNKYKREFKKEYKKLTEESIRELLNDVMYPKDTRDNKITLYTFGYEDEDGKIVCGFMDEFDKAMKEEARIKYNIRKIKDE